MGWRSSRLTRIRAICLVRERKRLLWLAGGVRLGFVRKRGILPRRMLLDDGRLAIQAIQDIQIDIDHFR